MTCHKSVSELCDFSGIKLKIELIPYRSGDYPFPWTPFDPTIVPPGKVAVSIRIKLTGQLLTDEISWFFGQGVYADPNPLFFDFGSAFGLNQGYFNDFSVINIIDYTPNNGPLSNPDGDDYRMRIVLKRQACNQALELTKLVEINGTNADIFGNADRWEILIDNVITQTVLP